MREVADALGGDLSGMYLFGSAALEDFRAGRSDLDVAVVAARPMAEAEKAGLAARLDHRRLPCPARKLELVVYERHRLARGDVSFELDLNTGRDVHEWRTDPAAWPGHWFVIDVAIGRERGRALAGPPPPALFPAQDERRILRAICESLDWHADHADDAPADTVLNACRSWRFVEERAWSSKSEAGHWAARHCGDPAISQALDARRGDGPGPGVAAARRLARDVRARARQGFP